jgi:hypothetical protein
MSMDVAIPADRNMFKKQAEKILKHEELSARVECESKSNTAHSKTTGLISKSLTQYLGNITGKPRNQGITQTSHIVHCTQTAGSAVVKVQNILHGGNNITCSADCKYGTAATLCKYKQGLFEV